MQRYLLGELSDPAADISNYVGRWHSRAAKDPGSPLEPLHNWLGMTWSEYQLWVERPDSLPEILDERNRTIQTMRRALALLERGELLPSQIRQQLLFAIALHDSPRSPVE